MVKLVLAGKNAENENVKSTCFDCIEINCFNEIIYDVNMK